MAPEGHQQRGDVGERGGQQQEERGLGAEPRAVAALHRVREELVQRHERRAAARVSTATDGGRGANSKHGEVGLTGGGSWIR